MTQDILTVPNEILTTKCVDVLIYNNDKGVKSIVKSLEDTLASNKNGCGLAAPQIGMSVNAFIVNHKHLPWEIFINPEITFKSQRVWKEDEGCLSIPGVRNPVLRHWEIVVRYYNKKLKMCERCFSYEVARIIQHEYDHLQGILITDYIK